MNATIKLRGQSAIMGMRLSYRIFLLSLDLFVTMFLWNETNHNMGLLCLYKVIFVLSMFGAMCIFAYLSRSRHRKWIIALGQCLLLIYVAILIGLGSNCVRYIEVLAFLEGFGTGMYYLIYNQYEAEGISDDLSARAGFLGIYSTVATVIKVVYPFVTGFLMDKFGIFPVCIFCFISSAITILFIARYNDKGYDGKISFKNYFNLVTENTKVRKSAVCFMVCDFFRAFTLSYGSFALFINICLMGFSEDASTFGSTTSILFLLSMIFSMYFKKFTVKSSNIIWNTQKILQAIAFVMGLAMFWSKHAGFFFSIFMLIWNFYSVTDSLVYSTAEGTFSKRQVPKCLSECYIINEAVLTIGRVIGYELLYLFWTNAGTLQPGSGHTFTCAVMFMIYMFMNWCSYYTNKKLWKLNEN